MSVATAEQFYKIDLADIGPHVDVGKTHRITWRRTGWRWVKDPRGGYRRQDFTRWIAARFTRTGKDQLQVLITSRVYLNVPVHRARVTLFLREKPNAVCGSRLWLTCPDCCKPVRILYWRNHWLRCRRCSGLVHKSNVTFKTQRRMKRERDLHRILGGDGNIRTLVPLARPRYMRSQRHADLLGEYFVLNRQLSDLRHVRILRAAGSLFRRL